MGTEAENENETRIECVLGGDVEVRPRFEGRIQLIVGDGTAFEPIRAVLLTRHEAHQLGQSLIALADPSAGGQEASDG